MSELQKSIFKSVTLFLTGSGLLFVNGYLIFELSHDIWWKFPASLLSAGIAGGCIGVSIAFAMVPETNKD